MRSSFEPGRFDAPHLLRSGPAMPRTQPAALVPALTASDFRAGMARLGAAVSVVTTDGPAGRAGFTASAVCSVTDDPPTLLVCLNRSSSVHSAFTRNDAVCVNTLADEQRAVAAAFARSGGEERFRAGTWCAVAGGAPALQDALAQFQGTITSRLQVGTHDVLICAVHAVRWRAGTAGLAWFDRGFCALPASAD